MDAAAETFIACIDWDFPFMREVPSQVSYQPFRHLHQAFQRFFAKTGRHPRFKSKHRDRLTFKVGKVRCEDDRVHIPVIGAVACTEALRWPARIVSSTVTADADRWKISILCEVPDAALPTPPAADGVIGIDLGLTTFCTDLQERKVLAPKPLRTHLKRLVRRSRELSRRRRGSRRRYAARMRLARMHRRIRHIRSGFLHQLTTSIVHDNQVIAIEDLNIQGMIRNPRLARAISDAGWHEFRRQLTYTCVRYRRTLVAAHVLYPSSKRCSRCGHHHQP